jgi:cell division protein FtsN
MGTRLDRRYAGNSGAPSRGPSLRKHGKGNTLLGVFIGVVLGLAIAAGVAFYLLKTGHPYQPAPSAREGREGAPRTPRADNSTPDKPRFDFYKILPAGEEPKVQPRTAGDKATADRATAPAGAAAPEAKPAPDPAVASSDSKAVHERFWLQAGSFAAPAEAENLKARLALAGWEASVQEANLPEKGTRYRVRIGPYDNTEELNRIKNELSRRGFDVAVIKF